jgi:hypothetical protein
MASEEARRQLFEAVTASWRVETCGPWLNRVVQDDLIVGYCVGQSASRDPSELRTRRDRGSRLQPRLVSRKAEEAAAARNSGFAGCRGSREAVLAASRVWVVRAAGCNPLDWAWRGPPYLRANRAEPSFVPGLECWRRCAARQPGQTQGDRP